MLRAEQHGLCFPRREREISVKGCEGEKGNKSLNLGLTWGMSFWGIGTRGRVPVRGGWFEYLAVGLD